MFRVYLLHILRPLLPRVVYLRQFRPVVPAFVGPCFIRVTWTYIPLRLIDMLITLEYRSGFSVESGSAPRVAVAAGIFRPDEKENSPRTRTRSLPVRWFASNPFGEEGEKLLIEGELRYRGSCVLTERGKGRRRRRGGRGNLRARRV